MIPTGGVRNSKVISPCTVLRGPSIRHNVR